MAAIQQSFTALAKTDKHLDTSADQSDSGPSRGETQKTPPNVEEFDHTIIVDEVTREALKRLTIDDELNTQTAEFSIDGVLKQDTPPSKNEPAVPHIAVHNTTPLLSKQRPWAEPPIVSYTETLDRQVKWQKLFLKAPFITPEQRCRIFDLVGENDALQLYISSLPDTEDALDDFAEGLFEEVYQDQRDVEDELNEFMDKEGLTVKIQDLKEALSWQEWCAIWCDGNHQRDCPAMEDI